MAAIELTQEEFDSLFTEYPTVRKAESGEPICPHCGNGLSPKALEYFNQSTEAGTPCCTIEITCYVCHKVIWRGGSWWPEIEDKDELLKVAREVLEEKIE